MKIALVAIAKNEDHYINEWIRYNLKLGFSKIFIYQNDWITNIDSDIDSSKIECIDWPTQYDENGKVSNKPQMSAYSHFIKTHYMDFDWGAFFDCDEFLYMNKVKDLRSLLKIYKNDMSIQIDWRLFGDNGHKEVKNGNYSVIDRFTMSAKKQFGRGKSMINFNLAKDSLVVGHETFPIKPIKVNPLYAEIAHYLCKTWQEFLNRRANSNNIFYSISIIKKDGIKDLKRFFIGKNKNEVKNTKVYDFYHKNDIKVVISITSFKPRIIDGSLLKTLKSLINQKFNEKYKICLTIAKNDMQYLTQNIIDFIHNHEIELLIDEIDIKSHKKYFYAMKKYTEIPIITVDDDVIYDDDLIQTLYNAHNKFPDCIIARRCHLMTYDLNGKIQSYKKWKYCYTDLQNNPNYKLFATGVGGILYPQNSIDINNIKINDMLQCENDDIFLKFYEQKNNIKVVYAKGKRTFGYDTQQSSFAKYSLCYTNAGDEICNNDNYIKQFNII